MNLQNEESHPLEQKMSSEWADAGTALSAVRTMCTQTKVSTADFHRVYARVLNDTALVTSQPGIIPFFEQLLHADDPYRMQAMHDGQISTVLVGEELRVPQEALPSEGSGYDVKGRVDWVVAHRDLAQEITKLGAKKWSAY